MTIASATVTFWCITVVPGAPPMIRPIWSPTVSGISHQPSPQERIPRVFHIARVLEEARLGSRRHRPERVVDQVRRVGEDRELIAVLGEITHSR